MLAMLAKAGAATLHASGASRSVLAKAGAATLLAPLAPLVMLAEAGAFAFPASPAQLAVLASLVDVPLALDWMRRWGFRRCQNCWSYQIHDVNGSGSKF